MLPSEFYDRTGVNLTGEDYAEVEKIYNAVEMNKDDFCELWLGIRENQLFKELWKAYRYSDEHIQNLLSDKKTLEETLKAEQNAFNKRVRELNASYKSDKEVFARKILIEAIGAENKAILDMVEEEFGFDFIVQVKLEENLPLLEADRTFLIKAVKNML